MVSIRVINQKGGVGKSTSAHAIGAQLMQQGNKVLYIDTDPQGNLSFAMGANMGGYGTMGILERPETIQQEIQHTPQGDIVASSPNLALADKILTDTGKEYRLKESLEKVSGLYDYVIIDTPPALSVLTVNALTACTDVLIVAQADIFSLQGIGQLNNTIDTIKKYCNPQLKIDGIAITRYNGRAILSKDMAETMQAMAEQMHTKLYTTK